MIGLSDSQDFCLRGSKLILAQQKPFEATREIEINTDQTNYS